MNSKAQLNLGEYESKLIRSKAKKLIGRFGYTRSDQEDIEQELLLHLLERRDQFDPSRSSHQTYVNRIIDRKIISILRKRYAHRRDYRRAVSLDELMGDCGEGVSRPLDQRVARVEPPTDLAIDLADAIERLDPELREVCELRKRESLIETARRLGLTRSEARSRMAKIRSLLTDAGLKEYLKD